ncbi:MAG: PDZ domain-containing protein [Pirellulales bacterium]
MNRQNFLWIVVTLFASAISYRVISRNPYARQIGEAFEKIERNYVVELNPDKRTELSNAAIQTMVEQLHDPNSSFIPGDDSEKFQNSLNGEFGGIGIEPWNDPAGKRMVVRFPIPGGPADRAGIKAGDEITAIDHVAIDKLGYGAAVERIRGPIDTKVDLTVKRNGRAEPFDVPGIVRSTIVVPSVLGYRRAESGTWSYVIDGAAEIVYLHIGQFGMHTTEEIQQILENLKGASSIAA